METLLLVLGLIGISPAFWGVAVGSLFSISGVMLTNRATAKRLRDQFSHDRQLRIAEREYALRRDVYLAATEATATTIASFGKFPNLNIPFDEITKTIAEKIPLVAKVHVIGGNDIVKGLIAVAGEISTASQTLTIQRIPLSLMKAEIDTLDTLIVRFIGEKDKLLELMKSHNLNGETDGRRWEFIQGSFKFEEKAMEDAVVKRKGLQIDLFERQLVYTGECIQATHKIGLLLTPILLAVRKELDLPLDAPSYTKMHYCPVDR